MKKRVVGNKHKTLYYPKREIYIAKGKISKRNMYQHNKTGGNTHAGEYDHYKYR